MKMSGNQQDQFNIRWNHYGPTLQSHFRRLYETHKFTDVSLACEGRTIPCHRFILSACSIYFEKLLSESGSNSSNSNLIIYMADMKFKELQALVTYMYYGEVSVDQNKLPALVKAAELLRIKGLCKAANVENEENPTVNGNGKAHKENNSVSQQPHSILRPQHQQQMQAASGLNRPLKRRIDVGPPKLIKMQKPAIGFSPGNVTKMNKEVANRMPSPPMDEESEEETESESPTHGIKEETSTASNASGSDEEDAGQPAPAPTPIVSASGNEDLKASVISGINSGMTVKQCIAAFGVSRNMVLRWRKDMMQNCVVDEVDDGQDGDSGDADTTPSGGPIDREDRADRLQKAADMAMSGVTVRQSAAYYEIPRTTLCAYMKRRGLSTATSRAFKKNMANSQPMNGNGHQLDDEDVDDMDDSEGNFPFLSIPELMDEIGAAAYLQDAQDN